MSLIGVHVIGGGYGECVIIQFPDRSVGVIDPYCPNFFQLSEKNRVEQHPIIRLLKNVIKPSSIRFVLLTHPHADHCMGAYHFLCHFEDSINNFLVWHSFGLETSIKFLLYLKGQNRRDETEEALGLPVGTILEELHKVRKWVREHRHKHVFVGEGRNIEIVLDNNKGSISLSFCAPTDQFLSRFNDWMSPIWERVHICGRNLIIPLDTVPSEPNLNHLSAVAILRWEKTKLLFCGDAETETWDQILDTSIGQKDLGIFFLTNWVKISHHGSHTGYNDRLLSLLNNAQPIGVLTPFYRGAEEKRLPSTMGMSCFVSCFREIWTTCAEKSCHILGFQPRVPPEAGMIMGIPPNWMTYLIDQPELCKAFRFFPETFLVDWSPEDFELPQELYGDLLMNPELAALFRHDVRVKIETILNVVSRYPENMFRVCHWFDESGKSSDSDMVAGIGVGSYNIVR